jgi:hypothetical protein
LLDEGLGDTNAGLEDGDVLIKGIQPTMPESKVPIAAMAAITTPQNWMFRSQFEFVLDDTTTEG